MKRQYNTLGRRILSMLAIGGPRKYNVLVGFARAANHTEKSLKRTLERLTTNGLLIRRSLRRGGVHYALAKKPT